VSGPARAPAPPAQRRVVGQKVQDAKEALKGAPDVVKRYADAYSSSFRAAVECGLGLCAEAYAGARAGALIANLDEHAEFAAGYAAGTFGQARAAEDEKARDSVPRLAHDGALLSADFDAIDQDEDVADATALAVAANGEAKHAGLGEAARHAAGAVAFAAFRQARKLQNRLPSEYRL